MLPIEPVTGDGGDEELGAVGVASSVSHRQEAGALVLQLEVLISKLLTIDRLTTSAVMVGEVTTLEHELGDDAVEGAVLVGQTAALLASAEGTEVLGSLGNHISVQLKSDAAELGTVGGDVKEDSRVAHDG